MSEGKTVAIIPVRGGSRGIPRKNARLLAGKPLLAYSIEAARRANQIDIVFISTEDPELAEIARRYGGKVLSRRAELAVDQTGLDEVIVDAVDQIEKMEISVCRVVTIQATSPLISAQTIDRACLRHAQDNVDTVLSVVDDTHLRWGLDDGGRFVPLYEQRVNRQLLPRQCVETGSVVVCSRRTLKSGSRFGRRVVPIEIDKTEAIDIDDYFDWWLAEKSLLRRRICFHLIGNSSTGLGHVYRALTLADRLINHDLYFIVNEQSRLAAELIGRRFYSVTMVPEGQESQAILAGAPDLVINDVLDTEESFVRSLKDAGVALINFEDIGPGSVLAEYLINAMYKSHPVRTDDRVLEGVEYSCLRDEFYSIGPKSTRQKIKTVLLLFGGTDPGGLTMKCLRSLDDVEGDWKVTVILGMGYKDPESVRRHCSLASHPTEVISDTSIISRYMAEADIAITSAGRTVFELASLCVPMIVMAQNERETHHVFACSSPGVIYCGLSSQFEREKFMDAFMRLAGSDVVRKKMSAALLNSGIREGVVNVIDVIEKTLRESGSEKSR